MGVGPHTAYPQDNVSIDILLVFLPESYRTSVYLYPLASSSEIIA